MEWQQVSLQDRERLLALHRSKDDAALIWEAERRGIKFITLKRRLQELNAASVNPEDTRPSWQDYLRITTDDMVFIGDIEIPDHHEELMEYARQIGNIYEIDNCLWAGDIVASDQFSNWPVTWAVKQEAYEENLKTAKRYFTFFNEVYENQYVISGNHDERVSKVTLGHVSLGTFFDLPGVTFSRYSYANVNSSRGLIRVTHPSKNFAEDGVALGRRLMASLDIPSHLIVAHCHVGARGWSKNGVHEIIALGCMRDPLKTQYKRIIDTTYAEWQPGFAMMKNGYFYQLNYYSADWKSVMKGNLIA